MYTDSKTHPTFHRSRGSQELSKAERLYQYLLEHGRISTLEAREKFDLRQPHGCVRKLRRAGAPIRTILEPTHDLDGGMRVTAVYMLDAQAASSSTSER